MTAAVQSKSPASRAAPRFVRTPSYEEALARLQFVIERGSRVGLLVGDCGSGKTTLLADVAHEARRSGALVAAPSAAALTPAELLWSIAVGLQAPVDDIDGNIFDLRRAVHDRLLELRFLRQQAVVLVDDAGLASPDLLPHLYRLAQGEAAADAQLSLILATTPETAPRLGRNLLELVDLRIDLPAWSLDETRVLADAPDPSSPRFTPVGLARLHELSRGMPRAILRLAELARLAASAESLSTIDDATVEGIYAELGVHAAAG